ncbi:hypothetical protein [Paenibacillus sp. FSL R5-0914]|uniref:hypothetical protein n=1 Tax=Paenibacillus sp. FSL R5-0914 TaxID=2921665 RepID=UPI0030F7D60F
MHVKDVANVLVGTRKTSSREDIQKALFSVFMLEEFFEGNREITDLFNNLNLSFKYLVKEEHSLNERSLDRAVGNLGKLLPKLCHSLVIPEKVEVLSKKEMEAELEFLQIRKEELDNKLSEEGNLSEEEFEEFVGRLLCLELSVNRKIGVLTPLFLDFERAKNAKYSLHEFRIIGGILLGLRQTLGKESQTLDEENRVNLISSARQFIERLKLGSDLNESMNEMASAMEEVRRGKGNTLLDRV